MAGHRRLWRRAPPGLAEPGEPTAAAAPDPDHRLGAIERIRRDLASLAAIEAPHRNALSVIAIACVMASLFAASYSLALGRATPHHIPAALVGAATKRGDALLAALEQATEGSLDFHRYSTLAGAETAIGAQHLYAALDLGTARPTLFIASASGASVARVLIQAADQVEQRDGLALGVIDLHPLPPNDPQGLVSFYVTLAATIVGFTTMFQLRANAARLSLRAWLGYIVLLATSGGLLLNLVVGPLIGALAAPLWTLWAALGAEIAVAALVCSTLIVLVHRWAILPAWLLFVVLGNSSSGGAVAPPLLPPVYAFIGRFLPPGATVNTIRSATYFAHAQPLEPIVVEAVWLACGLVSLILATRLLHRLPSQP